MAKIAPAVLPQIGHQRGVNGEAVSPVEAPRFDIQALPERQSPVFSPRPVDLVRSRLSFDAVDSAALRAVNAWWSPVEESVKCRHVEKLAGAVKVAHGGIYMKTVKAVRRSQSLRAVERHELEMEMAARLVQARTVLGKWEAGLKEIQAARKARDMERLEETLGKWDFADDDPEVVAAKQDLNRWQSLAVTLPSMLEAAVKNRDVAKIKENLGQLRDSGPARVPGLELAKKVVAKHKQQTKQLHHAVKSGNTWAIEAHLQSWRFDSDDGAVTGARQALQEKENLKAALRAAINARHGGRLEHLISRWRFEATDRDFVEARELLAVHTNAASELRRLARSKDLASIGDGVARWDFTQDDPAYVEARELLLAHEAKVGAALGACDGWALQCLLLSTGGPRALSNSSEEVRQETIATYKLYVASVAALRERLAAQDAGGDEELTQEELQRGWEFAEDDPNLQSAISWLQVRAKAKERAVASLTAATKAGHARATERALNRLRRFSSMDLPQCLDAMRLSSAYCSALDAAGTLALGITPSEMREATMRAAQLDEAAQRVQTAAKLVDKERLAELRNIPRVEAAVHGVFEVCMHLVAGVNPSVKDPPRDTQWRSVQRMLTNVTAFISHLENMPEWLASGNLAGVGRARATCLKLEAQMGDTWSAECLCSLSDVAAQLFHYAECVFRYAEVLDNSNRRAESIACGDVPLGKDGHDAWGRGMSPRPGSASSSRWTPVPGERPTSRGSAGSHERPSSRGSGQSSARFLATRDVDRARFSMSSTQSMLSQARRSIAGVAVLAAAWKIIGGDPRELEVSLEGVRRYAMTAHAQAAVSELLLSSPALKPATPVLSLSAAPNHRKSGTTSTNSSPRQSLMSARAGNHQHHTADEGDTPVLADAAPKSDGREVSETIPDGVLQLPTQAVLPSPAQTMKQTDGATVKCASTPSSPKNQQTASRRPQTTDGARVGPAGKRAQSSSASKRAADAAGNSAVPADKPRLPDKPRPPSMPSRGGRVVSPDTPSVAQPPVQRPQEQWTLFVNLISGAPVAELTVDASALAKSVAQRVANVEGSLAQYLRLFIGSQALVDNVALCHQGVTNRSILTLVDASRSLPMLLDIAASEVAACHTGDFDALGPTGRPKGEPAALLLHGVPCDGSGPIVSTPRPSTAQQRAVSRGGKGLARSTKAGMLDALRAAMEVLRSEHQDSCGMRRGEDTASPRQLNAAASSDAVTGVAEHGIGGSGTAVGPASSAATSQQLASPAHSAATPRPPTSPASTSARPTTRGTSASNMRPGAASGRASAGADVSPAAIGITGVEAPAGKELRVRHDPVQLTPELVRSLQVPQTNLSLARYALQQQQHVAITGAPAGEGPHHAKFASQSAEIVTTAVANFVNAMHMFYYDFVIQRFISIDAKDTLEEAETTLRHAEEAVRLASDLVRVDETPACQDIHGVQQVASVVAGQVVVLAQQGLALPAVHLEHVRQAIDSAGSQLLATPPAPNPGERLLWAEQAMALQLSPLPYFINSLRSIAKSLDARQLEEIAHHGNRPPAPEAIRLLAAVAWLVNPACRCDSSWADSRARLYHAEGLVEDLEKWSPVRDCTPQRLTRARELLIGCWAWVHADCGGCKAFGVLFAWASFAAVLLPMVEMAQRLIPVHMAVRKGIAKIQKAPKEQEGLVKAKAWTAALFLLDGRDEPWWWLQLIRPAAKMDPPWLDGEDGGLGASAGPDDSNDIADSPRPIEEDAASIFPVDLDSELVGLEDQEAAEAEDGEATQAGYPLGGGEPGAAVLTSTDAPWEQRDEIGEFADEADLSTSSGHVS